MIHLHGRWSTIGGVSAIATLPVHLLIHPEQSVQLVAVTLAVVAAIYVGFGLADGRTKTAALEIGVALAFATCAFLTFSVSKWIGPIAFAVHGLWDYAHDHGIDTKMPRWYIPFCAFFDWVFALGLAAIWMLEG